MFMEMLIPGILGMNVMVCFLCGLNLIEDVLTVCIVCV